MRFNFGKSFFSTLDEIDKIISQAPNAETLERVTGLTSIQEFNRYFFLNLTRSDWLEPLSDHGHFNNPDKKIENPYQQWEQGQYLKKMVTVNPQLIYEIFLAIADSKNYEVKGLILESIKFFNKEQKLNLIQKINKWFNQPQDHKLDLLAESLALLACSLAEDDLKKEGKELFLNILDLEAIKSEFSLKEGIHTVYDIKPRIDSWRYGVILEKIFSQFFLKSTHEGLEILYSLLLKIIELKRLDNPPADYSIIWCKEIEKSSLVNSFSIEERILAATRDYFIKSIEMDQSYFQKIEGFLKKPNWKIFERLYLYILSEKPTLDLKSISNILKSSEKSNDHYLTEEYKRLLKNSFNLLGKHNKVRILKTLFAGPDSSYLYIDHKNPTKDEEKYADFRKAFWIYDKASQIKNFLPEEILTEFNQYEQVIEKHNKLHPPIPKSGWVGQQSRYSLDDLKDLDNSQLISCLKEELKKEGNPWEPSGEDLGRIFQKLIENDPNKAVELKDSLIGPLGFYASYAIRGITESLKKVHDENWTKIFEFWQSIFEKYNQQFKEDTKGEDSYKFNDSIIQNISWTLESTLKNKIPSVFSLEEDKVLNLITLITSHSDPTPIKEKEFGGQNMDEFNLALNSTRPIGISCVIEYALGLYPDKDRTQNNWTFPKKIKEILELHLNKEKDPSPAVRSMYGRYLPWINLMDSNWLKANVNKIFPSNPEDENLFFSALKTYLKYCPPYDDTYDSTKVIYLEAVKRINQNWKDDQETEQAKTKLGEHILAFYLRNKIKYEDELFREFFKNASLKIRTSALRNTFFSIHKSKNELNVSITKNIISLIDKRYNELKGTPEIEEISGFGWIFETPNFDQEWRLKIFLNLLNEKIALDRFFNWDEELLKLSANHYKMVLKCFEKLIEKEDNIKIYHRRDKLKELITSLIKHGESKKQESKLKEIVNLIGSKGLIEFREFA